MNKGCQEGPAGLHTVTEETVLQSASQTTAPGKLLVTLDLTYSTNR